MFPLARGSSSIPSPDCLTLVGEVYAEVYKITYGLCAPGIAPYSMLPGSSSLPDPELDARADSRWPGTSDPALLGIKLHTSNKIY